jgi:hypothetical protein
MRSDRVGDFVTALGYGEVGRKGGSRHRSLPGKRALARRCDCARDAVDLLSGGASAEPVDLTLDPRPVGRHALSQLGAQAVSDGMRGGSQGAAFYPGARPGIIMALPLCRRSPP